MEQRVNPVDEEQALEKEFSATDEENLVFKYSITSYGADYPVDGLVKRIKNDDIFVPPFQRNYVWSFKMACRFIESLLLGLPVPGIFLSKEKDSKRLQVIDGHQRLRTLQFFYDGTFGPTRNPFELAEVNDQYCGKKYSTLSDDDRRELDNSIIHATVVKQDEPTSDESSIYQIFERLNTGAMLLSPQEIRSCIYHGLFNDLLHELNDHPTWRKIFGKENKRMRDVELILRFLALFYNDLKYTKPMKEFLNEFMGTNKNPQSNEREDFKRLFCNTIDLTYKAIGDKAFRPFGTINAAVFDSVMIGIARRAALRPINDLGNLRNAYECLIDNPDFVRTTSTATTDEDSVNIRIELACEHFDKVV